MWEMIAKIMAVESCHNLRFGRDGAKCCKEKEKQGKNTKHVYSIGVADLSSLYGNGKKLLT
jgi:hypothetical protein